MSTFWDRPNGDESSDDELYSTESDTESAEKPTEVKQSKSTFVVLNVGGEKFSISTQTIGACTPNFFSLLIGHNPDKKAYFVDRDPKVFRHVLLFLRGYSNPLPSSEEDLLNLKDDALFYGLPALVSMINSRLSEMSSQQELFSDKPEPSWAKQALLVQYKNAMNDAISSRNELYNNVPSESESEKFIRDHLNLDEYALSRDDMSTWPTTALKSVVEKMELICKRYQIALCLSVSQAFIFRAITSNGLMGEEVSFDIDSLPSANVLEEMVLKMKKSSVEKFAWMATLARSALDIVKQKVELQQKRLEEMRQQVHHFEPMGIPFPTIRRPNTMINPLHTHDLPQCAYQTRLYEDDYSVDNGTRVIVADANGMLHFADEQQNNTNQQVFEETSDQPTEPVLPNETDEDEAVVEDAED